VNLALAGVALVTVAGAVLAVTAREARAAVLGLLVVLLAAPLLVDPPPGPLVLAARLASALLAGRLLLIAVRGDDVPTDGSRIGWPAEILAAAAAGVIGFGSHGLGATGLGPAEAQAAGFALGTLAAAPLIRGRDVLRLGIGASLLVVAAVLIRTAVDAAPTEFEQLLLSALVVSVGGAVAIVADGARSAGGLAIGERDAWRGRPPDAHRLIIRPGSAGSSRRQAIPLPPAPPAGDATLPAPQADAPAAAEVPAADVPAAAESPTADRRGPVARRRRRGGTS
jgi:hypothetical protein